MRVLINNKVYYKSNFKDVKINNENFAISILNNIKSKPNKVLVIDEENKYESYDIVNNIEKVARGLNLLNINKNDIVCSLLPNMIEVAYVLLGSILNGGIVSIANPYFTVDEIKNTISTLNPKLLFIDYTNYNRLKSNFEELFSNCDNIIVINDNHSIPIINLESKLNFNNKYINIIDFNRFIRNDGKYNLNDSNVNIDNDIALVLFSSGTTGKFKGVCLTHSNLLYNIEQSNYTIHSKYMKESTKVLTSIPFYHAYGLVVNMFSFLSCGCSFIVYKKYNLKLFLNYIQNEKPTVTFLVPPIAIDIAKSKLTLNYDTSSIQIIYFGGSTLLDEIVNLLITKFKNQNLKIMKGYGLTETSALSSITLLDKIYKANSNGYLVSNIQAKIIDVKNGNNLDINQIGEICLKGPNIMKGYFNNLNETKNVIDNEGFLLTGDIGYFNEDGELFLIDRKKDLIKSYGNQVSPSELESILLSHPKIKDACVIGVPSTESGESPRAFIVLKQNENLTTNEIHKWINPKISFYKYINGGIYFINEIPKTQSGKILRNILKDYKINPKL